MATAKDVINWAASQIGVKESPAGSNRVKYWDMYAERAGRGWQGSPWCAAFVSVGYDITGVWKMTSDEGRFRYCPSTVNWAKENGLWRTREQGGQAGDLIIFGNKGTACHIGFVEKVISGSKYQTIEGNTSVSSNDNGGAVMRRTRELGTVGSGWYIMGFVHPKFDGASTTTTTNDSGKSKDTIVKEVIEGKWGNGQERANKLKAAGYDPAEIQRLVNIKLSKTPTAAAAKPAVSSAGLPATYQVQVSSYLRVRTGAGTGYRAKSKNEVTADAQRHWKNGGLANGTRVTVANIQNTGNETWGHIPSGWICIKQNGSTFAKRV